MLQAVTHSWWRVALRGALTSISDVAAIAVETLAITLVFMVVTFAMLLVTFGVLAIGLVVPVLAWVVGAAAGAIALIWPGLITLTLLYSISLWATVTALARIAGAIRLRHLAENEWILVTGGLLSVSLGALAIVSPGTDALSVIWLTGIYTIILGSSLLLLAFRSRNVASATARTI
jgi:uncharacterized membrane protein HdeD (DUF308 family)